MECSPLLSLPQVDPTRFPQHRVFMHKTPTPAHDNSDKLAHFHSNLYTCLIAPWSFYSFVLSLNYPYAVYGVQSSVRGNSACNNN